MPATTIDDLRDALGLGLGIVTRIWEYKTEGGWVTSVFAADIDNDGDIEVIACSRQGRVIMLSKEGDCRWVRVMGANSWVGTAIASDFLTQGENTYARIIVGTRNGKVIRKLAINHVVNECTSIASLVMAALPFG